MLASHVRVSVAAKQNIKTPSSQTSQVPHTADACHSFWSPRDSRDSSTLFELLPQHRRCPNRVEVLMLSLIWMLQLSAQMSSVFTSSRWERLVLEAVLMATHHASSLFLAALQVKRCPRARPHDWTQVRHAEAFYAAALTVTHSKDPLRLVAPS